MESFDKGESTGPEVGYTVVSAGDQSGVGLLEGFVIWAKQEFKGEIQSYGVITTLSNIVQNTLNIYGDDW